MTETTLTRNIIHCLRREGFYVTKIHGSRYQQPGLPDVWAVRDGRLYCFEVKLSGNEPTKLQAHVIAELCKHGAVACVVYSVSEVEDVVAVDELLT